MSRTYGLRVSFDSPLELSYNTGLASLGSSMAARAGGYVNYTYKDGDGRYNAILYVPRVAITLFTVMGPDDFLNEIVSNYWHTQYKMTNEKVVRL